MLHRLLSVSLQHPPYSTLTYKILLFSSRVSFLHNKHISLRRIALWLSRVRQLNYKQRLFFSMQSKWQQVLAMDGHTKNPSKYSSCIPYHFHSSYSRAGKTVFILSSCGGGILLLANIPRAWTNCQLNASVFGGRGHKNTFSDKRRMKKYTKMRHNEFV